MTDVKIEPSWKKTLSEEFAKPYFVELKKFLTEEISQKKTIYPHPKNIFAAFDLCPFDATRVVILGQDPYHGENQAHGLCFSVSEGVRIPPSLQNIFKELQKEFPDFIPPKSGNLEKWARQGILLLNAVLTVRKNSAASHAGKGWEMFTDAVTKKLNDEKEGILFLLWGNYAKKKGAIIDRTKHIVLESAHPSPLSASRFFGCGHFEKVNEILRQRGEKEIEWNLSVPDKIN